MMSRIFRTLLLTAFVCLFPSFSYAQPISDPLGDFLFDTYAGPLNGDLDCLSAEVTFTGPEFVFSGTMAEDIFTTPETIFVWGVFRGGEAGYRDFARLGRPNIIFDIVVNVRITADGTISSLLTPLDGGDAESIPSENITIEGSTVSVRVPASLLPERGLSRDQYTWNLWPRWGGIPMSDEQISDFCPDFDNAPVTVAP